MKKSIYSESVSRLMTFTDVRMVLNQKSQANRKFP